MPTSQQIRKIKCPYCGWIRKMTIQVEGNETIITAGIGDVMRGISEELQKPLDAIKRKLEDKELDEANAWIDTPACPNPDCNKVYKYNVQTGETKK